MTASRAFQTSPIANEKMSVRESINSAMSDEIERDPNVFLIGEEVRNSLVPEENKILSLSLICASVFSDKKGIGSDLMDHFLHLIV